MNLARKLTVSAAAVAMAITGLTATTSSATVEGCYKNSYDVVWGYAGLYWYSADRGYWLNTNLEGLHYGQRVTGPTHGTHSGYTAIDYGAFVKEDAVTYRGCE